MALITPLIITFNEEANIGRVLAGLTWAQRVVVLDSGSTDSTQAICEQFANVDMISRPFDSFAAQCNYGLEAVESEWCLSLDADYVVPEETSRELLAVVQSPSADGFDARLAYCVRGHELRHAILPRRTVLFRTRLGRYEQDGHAHRLKLTGNVSKLHNRILHDDRKSMKRWLNSQQTYAEQEAAKIAATPLGQLSWPDRIRSLRVVAPWLVPSFYFLKGGLMDGWAGLDYAAQRAIAELVLSVNLIEGTELARADKARPTVTRLREAYGALRGHAPSE